MSMPMLAEADLFDEQDVDFSPEAERGQMIHRFEFAHRPGGIAPKGGRQKSAWGMQQDPAQVRLHSDSGDLFHAALPQHGSPPVARRAGAPAVDTERTAPEAWPAWISTNQLLEWVRLRAENANLRRDNGRLRQQLTALVASTQREVALTSVVADPAPAPSLQVCGFELPVTLSGLAEAIEQSRSLLDLEDDWDGEGTPSYAEDTWRRTVDFLVRYAKTLWEQRGIAAEDVEILPDTEGALAIDWRVGGREMLIRVPAEPTLEASYFGDDGSGRRKTKGTLDTSALVQSFVWWLAGE